jgi:hypothetical protein
MQWYSKQAPIYAWNGDIWHCEVDGKEYVCDIKNLCWTSQESRVIFPPKTKIMDK